MSISAKTPSVLMSMGYDSIDDFMVSKSGVGEAAIFTLNWHSVSPQPTEQEIATAEASQAYTDWYAENGGDPVKTLRKQAQDNLSESDRSNLLLRSVILTMVEEFNRHSDRTNAILTAVGNATSLGTLQSEVGLINPIPARTGAQLRAAAILLISAGDADS